MVFCGKPSGACHACRGRKTRCDQIPEGCTQCKRAKRKCPGYRPIGDVIFRDESKNVARKAKAKEARAKQAASKASTHTIVLTEEDTDSSSEEPCELVERTNSPLGCCALAPNIEDRATGFFIANYVVLDNSRTSGLPGRYIPVSKLGRVPKFKYEGRWSRCLCSYSICSFTAEERPLSICESASIHKQSARIPSRCQERQHITRYLNPRNIRIRYGIQSAMSKKLRRTQFVLSVLFLPLAY
jgi:hypothetical protein